MEWVCILLRGDYMTRLKAMSPGPSPWGWGTDPRAILHVWLYLSLHME